MPKENYRDLLARYYRVTPDDIDDATLDAGYEAIQSSKPKMNKDQRAVLRHRREQRGRGVVPHKEVLTKLGKNPDHAGWSSKTEIEALRHAVPDLDKVRPKKRRTE